MGTDLQFFVLSILTLFVLLVTTIYLYFKYSYRHWSKWNVAHVQPVFPFGNFKRMFFLTDSFADASAKLYNEIKLKSKLAGGIYVFSKPLLMLIDPELIKTILTNEFASFHDRIEYINEENDPLTAHLLALRGERWRYLRKNVSPIFSPANMKMMFHGISDCTKDLKDVMKGYAERREAIDILKIFKRLTTDTILSCAFGIKGNSMKNPDSEFRNVSRMFCEFGFREIVLNVLTIYPWILNFFKIPFTNPVLSKWFMDMTRSIVEYREKNDVNRKDFFNFLMRLRNNKSVLDDDANHESRDKETGLTVNELAAQMFGFFLAGTEPTSNTINFCMYELASNPDIQNQLRKELRDVLSKHGEVLSYEAAMSMEYMDKVVHEVLRKYPPASILTRQCTKDYYLPTLGYTFKKGSVVVVSTMGLQRDPEYYPEPDKFDPERFSEESKAKRHSYTYLPFGKGPRLCIGMRFAMLQIKLLLCMLLNDFAFSLDPKTITPISFNPKSRFLAPAHTIWLQARVANPTHD